MKAQLVLHSGTRELSFPEYAEDKDKQDSRPPVLVAAFFVPLNKAPNHTNQPVGC
jgi:hypothetical protein